VLVPVDGSGESLVAAEETVDFTPENVGYAEEVSAGEIVLGKRGVSESARDMLGSTTERVIRQAPVTVPFEE